MVTIQIYGDDGDPDFASGIHLHLGESYIQHLSSPSYSLSYYITPMKDNEIAINGGTPIGFLSNDPFALVLFRDTSPITSVTFTAAHSNFSFVPTQGAVPEPSTWALLALGFLVMAGVRAKRRRLAHAI